MLWRHRQRLRVDPETQQRLDHMPAAVLGGEMQQRPAATISDVAHLGRVEQFHKRIKRGPIVLPHGAGQGPPQVVRRVSPHVAALAVEAVDVLGGAVRGRAVAGRPAARVRLVPRREAGGRADG